jgi:Zn-dependent protease with chaperone function
MKYTPKDLEENVNVSPQSPLRTFSIAFAKILAVLVIIYFIIGALVDLIAPRVSVGTEKKIGALIDAAFKDRKQTEQELRLQSILDPLAKGDPALPGFDYKVYVQENQQVNAVALPAGNIVVFSGLIKEVKSENEMAMVLAHELGHFRHHDHLRGMGRQLLLLLLVSFFSGGDSSSQSIVLPSITTMQMRFSQKQEQAADQYGVDLLNKTYGHAAGATDFFVKMSKKDDWPKFMYFFSTHPYPASRIQAITERIQEKGYLAGKVEPLWIAKKE